MEAEIVAWEVQDVEPWEPCKGGGSLKTAEARGIYVEKLRLLIVGHPLTHGEALFFKVHDNGEGLTFRPTLPGQRLLLPTKGFRSCAITHVDDEAAHAAERFANDADSLARAREKFKLQLQKL